MEQVKNFICHNCNYETNRPCDWLRHCDSEKHKRQGRKKKHTCEECDYETTSAWNMKAHNLSQHATKEERAKQKYYCGVCDTVFFSPLYLQNHVNGSRHANYVKAVAELNKLKEE